MASGKTLASGSRDLQGESYLRERGVVPIYWLTVAATVAGAGAAAAGVFFFPLKNPVMPVAFANCFRKARLWDCPPVGCADDSTATAGFAGAATSATVFAAGAAVSAAADFFSPRRFKLDAARSRTTTPIAIHAAAGNSRKNSTNSSFAAIRRSDVVAMSSSKGVAGGGMTLRPYAIVFPRLNSGKLR